jgi:hypothetical protein
LLAGVSAGARLCEETPGGRVRIVSRKMHRLRKVEDGATEATVVESSDAAVVEGGGEVRVEPGALAQRLTESLAGACPSSLSEILSSRPVQRLLYG